MNYNCAQNGVAFSSKGRYLYVSHCREVGQINLWNPDNRNYIVLFGPDSVNSAFEQFHNLKLSPDGKIYIGNIGGQRRGSYIANLNELGLEANYVHKGLTQNLT